MNFRALCLALLVTASTGLLGACASSEPKKSTEREKVSTIPWNRPESWEGKGVLGGMGTGGN
jgi:hypothetical protein